MNCAMNDGIKTNKSKLKGFEKDKIRNDETQRVEKLDISPPD